MKAVHMIALILVVVGALNWGLLALTGWEIGALFGGMNALISKIVYILVGLSGLVLLVTHKKDCKACSGGSGGGKAPMPGAGAGM